MTNRDRMIAILNYQKYDRMPVVHFGFWQETLDKWALEGHISKGYPNPIIDGSVEEKEIAKKLGFDFNWFHTFPGFGLLFPAFEPEIVKENADGSKEFFNHDGVVVMQKDDARSIPAEVSHTLKDRKSWEELYKPKLQFSEQSITKALVNTDKGAIPFDEGGLEFLKDQNRDDPFGLMVGSLLGRIRDWLGVVNLSYMGFDDEQLLNEIIETVAELCYRQTEYMLDHGAKFDFAHYWEDVCFKNGPLISPTFFYEKIGPHYRRLSDLISAAGIDIISVDCDGVIDTLIPTWLENGVNTMFPIEVGTWNASIGPWRENYGKEIRGVGGMNKTVFAHDCDAIDKEIERLKPLVELGGYIPCPDHRIAPDAKWDNVRYYCDRMKEVFGT
jgi:uroporphyrinogen decarboxylase-like protein